MSPDLPCPYSDLLQRCLIGREPSSSNEEMMQHLEECDRCAAVVEALAVSDDRKGPDSALAASKTANIGPSRELIARMARLDSRNATRAWSNHPKLTQSMPLSAPSPSEGANPTTALLRIMEDGCRFAFLAPPLGPGELGRLGSYRVLKLLGEGAMGLVFQAEDVDLERPVALKVMKPEIAVKPLARARFFREARATAALEHEHIVPIYQVGEDRGVAFIAMKWLKGVTLEERISKGGPLSIEMVLRLGRQIALGLAAAHEAGLIHRDIKPENLWLEPDQGGRIKILDFGLARLITNDAQLTQRGVILGTPAYLAPEQVRCETMDARCDLYSLGVVLYRLCTGRLPFSGCDSMAVLLSVALDAPPPVDEINPSIPAGLADLVMQLLTKEPFQRPASASEVADRLAAVERQLLEPPAAAPRREEAPPPAPPDPPPPVPIPPPVIAAPPPSPPAIATPEPSPPAIAIPEPSPPAIATPEPSPPAIAAPEPSPPATAAPPPSPPAKPPRTRRRLFAVAALAALLPAGYFFGGAAVCFALNQGRVVIDVSDPAVEVTVKENGAVVHDAPGRQVITLPAGAHEMEVGVKEAGGKLRSFTKRFFLARGGKRVLDVSRELELLEEEYERQAARWVLEIGGRLTIRVRDKDRQVQAIKELPDDAFRVTRVSFYRNQQVTDAGLAHLEKLTHLSSLGLFGTPITDGGLGRLAKLTSLSVLELGKTQVGDAGLTHLETLTNLTSLQLAETRVGDAGLKHLQTLTGLSHLDLSKTRVTNTGLKSLERLKRLSRLDLSMTPVGNAGLKHLKALTNLIGLGLRGTQVGDAGLESLRALNYLESLDLAETRVGDAGLTHLAALRFLSRLDLGRTQVSDAGLTHLQALRKMDSLGLRGARLSARGCATLKKAFPGATIAWSEPNRSAALAVLALGGVVHVRAQGETNDSRVTSPASLPEEYFRLTRVSLANVLKSPAELWPGLAALGDPTLDDFHTLDLSGAAVGDRDLSALAALTTLRDLSLARTPVSDAGLESLKGLKKLRRLDLAGTKVTVAGIDALKKALPECQVVSGLVLKLAPGRAIRDGSEWDQFDQRGSGEAGTAFSATGCRARQHRWGSRLSA